MSQSTWEELYDGDAVGIEEDMSDENVFSIRLSNMSIMIDRKEFFELCNACYIARNMMKEMESKK